MTQFSRPALPLSNVGFCLFWDVRALLFWPGKSGVLLRFFLENGGPVRRLAPQIAAEVGKTAILRPVHMIDPFFQSFDPFASRSRSAFTGQFFRLPSRQSRDACFSLVSKHRTPTLELLFTQPQLFFPQNSPPSNLSVEAFPQLPSLPAPRQLRFRMVIVIPCPGRFPLASMKKLVP